MPNILVIKVVYGIICLSGLLWLLVLEQPELPFFVKQMKECNYLLIFKSKRLLVA